MAVTPECLRNYIHLCRRSGRPGMNKGSAPKNERPTWLQCLHLTRCASQSSQLDRHQHGREFAARPTSSATFSCRIRPRAPIGAFFLFVSKGVGRAIRPSETGRLTQNGSPNGPCLSSSAPRWSRGGAKHPFISNGLPVCGCPLFGKRNLRFVGGVFDRTCVRPLSVAFMTPRAGMLFGRRGSHRFRELPALEPRD